MGKITIHCVRHAQGYHNISIANHQMHDPDLTPTGERQCTTLSRNFPHHSKITHLVASPLRRTIYTCLLSFPDEVQAGLKIIALPELQETSDLPSDTGSDPAVLAEEFGGGRFAGTVDLSLVGEGWNSKTGRWSPASSAVEARARDARIWLRDLALSAEAHSGDVDIVVVTHGGYLHYLTEDWDGNDKFNGTGWANTEYRSYEFVDLALGDQTASLVETAESRAARVGDVKPLSSDEQRELKISDEREWRESGFHSGAESAKL